MEAAVCGRRNSLKLRGGNLNPLFTLMPARLTGHRHCRSLQRKSRLSAGPFLALEIRSELAVPAADRVSGPDGSDPAAAGRASGRRPAAADRASGPGSGSAGPGSGSGSHSGISLVERSRRSTEGPAHWLRSEHRFRRDHCVAKACCDCDGGTRAPKLALYKPLKPHLALLPPPVPAVRKWHDASFRLPGPRASPRSRKSVMPK